MIGRWRVVSIHEQTPARCKPNRGGGGGSRVIPGIGEDRGGGQKVEGAPAGLLVPTARREVVCSVSSTLLLPAASSGQIPVTLTRIGMGEWSSSIREERKVCWCALEARGGLAFIGSS